MAQECYFSEFILRRKVRNSEGLSPWDIYHKTLFIIWKN
jgi:hypothetical protein